MNKTLVTNFLILGLLLFVLILAFFVQKLVREGQEQPSVSTPQATVDPDIQKFAKLAPFTIEFMTVQYFDRVQRFLVIIEKPPFEDNKKRALDWFSSHGIKDLCKLNLEFSANPSVKERGTLTAEERTTPGCPLLPQT